MTAAAPQKGKTMRIYNLIMNFFSFWLHRHYENIIWADFAWELAKIHTEHDIEWDAMIILKERS